MSIFGHKPPQEHEMNHGWLMSYVCGDETVFKFFKLQKEEKKKRKRESSIAYHESMYPAYLCQTL